MRDLDLETGVLRRISGRIYLAKNVEVSVIPKLQCSCFGAFFNNVVGPKCYQDSMI